MNPRNLKGTGAGPSNVPAISPTIRLVQAFKEASESSKREPDLDAEAATVEGLLIAGEASFRALSRSIELMDRLAYGGEGPGGPVDRDVIEDGYYAWLDGADPLQERLDRLRQLGYEAGAFPRFFEEWRSAKDILREFKERRDLERRAMGVDRLAALAARTGPHRAESDPPEPGG